MEQKQTNDELLRLAIITLLVACMFGVLQYFPEEKTFDLGIDVVLKVVASTMLLAPFPIFVIYLIILGLNLRYKKKRTFLKSQAFFYDFGIALTIFIIIFTILLASLIWLLVNFPKFPMGIIVGVIWAFLIVGIIVTLRISLSHFKKKKL
ncbi:MAG: hypothetical protein PHE43_01240 [Candidatus Nanoarchaeia archaeon]|nr:hypothetical protein [Candidatus Nanoarchaeia archaeon]